MKTIALALCLLMACFRVLAQPYQPESIRVVGQASVSQVPDLFQFSLYLEEKGAVVSKLNDTLSDKTSRIIHSLLEEGVEKRDIASMQVRLQPWYEHRDGMTEQRGFVLSRTVHVSLRALPLYDKVLDRVFKIGASRMDGFEYGFEDPQSLYLKALQRAVEDARIRATKLAGAAGVKVGKVTTINELSQYRPAAGPAESRQLMHSDASMPGQQTIEARVEVQFELDY